LIQKFIHELDSISIEYVPNYILIQFLAWPSPAPRRRTAGTRDAWKVLPAYSRLELLDVLAHLVQREQPGGAELMEKISKPLKFQWGGRSAEGTKRASAG
jgi:hypothetical protein